MLAVSGAPGFSQDTASRSAYEACQAQDEDGLRAELASLSAAGLNAAMAKTDVRALIADAWRRNALDDVIDKRVDRAIEDVKSTTSWTERLKSLANSEASQKLATAVAERVYRSDDVKASLEKLSSDVAKDVGKGIEFGSEDAAGPMLSCLKAYIGQRYGSAVAAAVAADAGKDLEVDPEKAASSVTPGAMLRQTSGGLTGATILIVRRQLANLATRVGQRVVGSVLSRIVSVTAGGVGLVLIAKDIWELRNGVLPIIANEMKARTTKDKVQDELAGAITTQIKDHVQEIAGASAGHIIEIWQGFKRAHAIVLDLAGSDEKFQTFLNSLRPNALPRLDEITGLIVAKEGTGGVLKRLEDGSLHQAVNIMPDIAMQIARDAQSVPAALGWTAIAQDKLDKIVEYEIHARAKPEDFTRASLDKLLALDDRRSIVRLTGISADDRDALLGLEPAELGRLGRNLGENELSALAGYIKGLQPGPRAAVLNAVAADAGVMHALASKRVRDAILTSSDQQAAVDVMLKPAPAFAPQDFGKALSLVWEGRISPWLVLDKHPLSSGLAGLFVILIAAWLRRLLFPPARPETYA